MHVLETSMRLHSHVPYLDRLPLAYVTYTGFSGTYLGINAAVKAMRARATGTLPQLETRSRSRPTSNKRSRVMLAGVDQAAAYIQTVYSACFTDACTLFKAPCESTLAFRVDESGGYRCERPHLLLLGLTQLQGSPTVEYFSTDLESAGMQGFRRTRQYKPNLLNLIEGGVVARLGPSEAVIKAHYKDQHCLVQWIYSWTTSPSACIPILCSPCDEDSPDDTMSTTAANFPVELFDLMLSFYEHDPCNGEYDRPRKSVGINRRNLGTLALICRRWALACQPKIFEEISLKGLEDFNGLWELMSHPSSRIGGYLKTVRYELTNDSRIPWIHVACRKLKHYPKLSSEVQFRIHAQWVETKHITTGLSSPISRSHRIMCIDTLFLARVKFARLEDLRRVLRELPYLRKAELDMINWKEWKKGDELATVLSYGTFSRKSPTCIYSMRGCTDDSTVLWLACLCRMRELRTKDLQALYQIGCFIPGRGIFAVKAWMEKDSIYLDAHYWEFKATLRSTDTSQQYVHSLQFQIPDISYDSTEWMRIDEYIISLEDLNEVCFRFNDVKDMQTFATVIALGMPHLCCSSRLKFTLETTQGVEKRIVCHTDAIYRKQPHYPAPVIVLKLYREEKHVSHGQYWPSSSQLRPTDAQAPLTAAVHANHPNSIETDLLGSWDLSSYAEQVQRWQQPGTPPEHDSWCRMLETGTPTRCNIQPLNGDEGAQHVQTTRALNLGDCH
ncbi:hypothetical protein NM688_g7510 [Phlebia brevispora]|uniref:Uncharacterized protein n=1 Tax=Phlebia brevispora TaxID=194682 RepID=A0ACC1S4N6_9APHY|nr:hypothetical protein NM688_g7510 [Phlebia brevispora]